MSNKKFDSEADAQKMGQHGLRRAKTATEFADPGGYSFIYFLGPCTIIAITAQNGTKLTELTGTYERGDYICTRVATVTFSSITGHALLYYATQQSSAEA